MKTLAERLDDEERLCDEADAFRKMIKESLERGKRDAEAMLKAARGSFGWDPSLDRLRFR